MKENYTVYVHTLLNKKVYVGFMNLDSEYVQGKTIDQIFDEGRYHENRTALYSDIQKYGWQQVQTEIISGLTKDQAIKKKKELCLEYQSYLPELGYNRYADAGLTPPPKVDKTLKGKLAKKLVSMFLHGDFSIHKYVLDYLKDYPEDKINELFELIKNRIAAGYVALCMTRKKFSNPHSEVHYLLAVLDDPHCTYMVF